ncbi:MAG TPA: hypothetical protein VG056_01945, partial [Pirellulales bacterium]|nr:hypothetical protein [Pirellulales bacterium]
MDLDQAPVAQPAISFRTAAIGHRNCPQAEATWLAIARGRVPAIDHRSFRPVPEAASPTGRASALGLAPESGRALVRIWAIAAATCPTIAPAASRIASNCKTIVNNGEMKF